MTQSPVDALRVQAPDPLERLLHAYDDEVAQALDAALAPGTGTGRVRAMRDELEPAVVVHDAVMAAVLCPLLDRLGDGPEVADRVRAGCRERAEALRRLERLTRGVAAHNVYTASADEVDDILQALERSFDAHRGAETDAVRRVLTEAGGAVDPATVGEQMADAARRAPMRPHGRPTGAPAGPLARAAWRQRDRVADWFDAHHGWSGPGSSVPSPRRRQMAALQRLALGQPATVSGVLSAYDEAVRAELDELERAGTDAERADAAHRATAAVAIHDAVVGGVVCPLLRSVPGGPAQADALRRECSERADLLRAWVRMTRHTPAVEVYRHRRAEVDAVMESLRASFRAHEHDDAAGVIGLLQDLPPERFRRATALFADSMWPWHSEGPNLLALRMALWADRSPTRPHPLFLRHPSNRVLRDAFGFADHVHDRWHDTPLSRWLFPSRPGRPFAAVGRGNRAGAGRTGGRDG